MPRLVLAVLLVLIFFESSSYSLVWEQSSGLPDGEQSAYPSPLKTTLANDLLKEWGFDELKVTGIIDLSTTMVDSIVRLRDQWQVPCPADPRVYLVDIPDPSRKRDYLHIRRSLMDPPEEGVRERMMDSCTLPYYSMVAGDHDFRPNRTNRLKLYYTHKLKEYIGKWGQPSCVGCGRCIAFCPVDINVLSVSNALFGEVCETEEACDL